MPASDKQRRAGLGLVHVGHDLASARGGVGAELRGVAVAERGHQARAAFEGHHQQALQAGGDALLVRRTGPVEKAHAVDAFLAVRPDELGEALEQGGEISSAALRDIRGCRDASTGPRG